MKNKNKNILKTGLFVWISSLVGGIVAGIIGIVLGLGSIFALMSAPNSPTSIFTLFIIVVMVIVYIFVAGKTYLVLSGK